MFSTDTVSTLAPFSVISAILFAVSIRESDYSVRVKVITGRVLFALSLLFGIPVLGMLFSADWGSLPKHTANGLISTAALTVILLCSVLKLLPPVSMPRD